MAVLLRRRADIDINFLIAAEEPAAENKERSHDDYHKDNQHRYDASTASTIVVSHDCPPVKVIKLTRRGLATEQRQDFSSHITRVSL
jgi:hypothetical protein